VLGIDLQDRTGWQLAEEHSAFDLGLNNIVVDFIAQVGVWPEQLDLQVLIHGSRSSQNQ
jgi:hypothetical protein